MAYWTQCDNGCGVWLLVNDDATGPDICDDCTEEVAVIAGTLVIDEWAPDDLPRLTVRSVVDALERAIDKVAAL